MYKNHVPLYNIYRGWLLWDIPDFINTIGLLVATYECILVTRPKNPTYHGAPNDLFF